MNKNRRQELKDWIEKAENLRIELEQILSDEENYYDSIPENLQGSTNGMNSEEAIEQMNEAIENVYEAIGVIEEII